MKLPNGERAVIPAGKLTEYCLNPNHADGKHKARVFKSALGLTSKNSKKLKNLLLHSAQFGLVTRKQRNPFGTLYRVECEIKGIKQQEILCTLWIIHKNDEIPLLTSCFIKTQKAKK
ncbi:MAG: hypothetical protein DWQ10_01030 [Calditrichaeota bacterium]|nr:MAG: hypothetical protein DWQ10_01030 [Calditrichota bacterium]